MALVGIRTRSDTEQFEGFGNKNRTGTGDDKRELKKKKSMAGQPEWPDSVQGCNPLARASLNSEILKRRSHGQMFLGLWVLLA